MRNGSRTIEVSLSRVSSRDRGVFRGFSSEELIQTASGNCNGMGGPFTKRSRVFLVGNLQNDLAFQEDLLCPTIMDIGWGRQTDGTVMVFAVIPTGEVDGTTGEHPPGCQNAWGNPDDISGS